MRANSNALQGLDEYYYSAVQGGPFHRFREAVGLIPGDRLGIARRVLVIVSVAWLPVVIGALIAGQVLNGASPDPLLRHFAVHARLLVAVPLLLFADAIVEQRIPPMVRHFVTSGLVDSGTAPRFQMAIDAAVRVRDSVWGAVFVLTAMAAVVISVTLQTPYNDEFAWAIRQAPAGGIGFAGWWYVFVSRPIFAGLMAMWAWRMLALWVLSWHASKLELRLVPSHPDRVGGLGFLAGGTMAFAPVALAVSVVLAGIWGHDVLYHGAHVNQFKGVAVLFVILVVAVFNGPLLLWGRTIGSFRRRKLLEYSNLVGQHGRLVDRKWIDHEEVGSPQILDAPELGPVVDINAIYDAVANMRLAPINKHSILPIAFASALPLLPVFAIEVPIKDLLRSLMGALL